jgi:hypothetical protein
MVHELVQNEYTVMTTVQRGRLKFVCRTAVLSRGTEFQSLACQRNQNELSLAAKRKLSQQAYSFFGGVASHSVCFSILRIIT